MTYSEQARELIETNAHQFFFNQEEQGIKKSIEDTIDFAAYEYMTGESTQSNLEQMRARKFTFLAEHVATHQNFGDWIMKGGPKNQCSHLSFARSTFCDYDSVLRPFYAYILDKVTKQFNLLIDVPEKRLLQSKFAKPHDEPHRKYHVFSKRADVLSREESLNVWRNFDSKTRIMYAMHCCFLIRVGVVKDPSSSNLVFTKDKKRRRIVFLDTESQGALLANESNKLIFRAQGLKLFKEHFAEFPECVKAADYALSDRYEPILPMPKPSRCETNTQKIRECVTSTFSYLYSLAKTPFSCCSRRPASAIHV